jgi:hypothetical protein
MYLLGWPTLLTIAGMPAIRWRDSASGRQEETMDQASTRDVLFVGSVPGKSVEDVLSRCAGAVGGHAFAFPDGELGPRQMWVGAIGELAYSKHPGLERLPDTTLPFGGYRARDADVSFDEVYPYAEFALDSYRTFRRLRDAGELPENARFQVSLPTAHAAIVAYFPDVERWPQLFAAWSRAMRKGFDDMLAEIPAEELVIQLDYCTEFTDIAGVMDDTTDFNVKRSSEDRLRAHTAADYLAPMSENLPETVAFGYHICLGTWPTMRVARSCRARSERRVRSSTGLSRGADRFGAAVGARVAASPQRSSGPDESLRSGRARHTGVADFAQARHRP